MNDYVWLSRIYHDTQLVLFVDIDVVVDNVDDAIYGQKLNNAGQPVPQELCPKKIWGDKDSKPFKRVPHVLLANGQWVVSGRAASVFEKFDLGAGALYPVSEGFFQKDKVTPVEGTYFSWIFGNTKDVFLSESSNKIKEPEVPGLWWDIPWDVEDGDIAVSSAALDGPDVWMDKMLFRSVFLSASLGDALVAAGLQKAFRLTRCKVV